MNEASNGNASASAAGSLKATTLEASFTVNDLAKSMAWYCDVVGFKLEERHEWNGKVMGASLSAGTARIVIGQDDGKKGFDRVKGEACSLYLTTPQNIDELATGIVARGGTIASGPEDTPWGVRLIRLQDPDGFKFAISSPRK